MWSDIPRQIVRRFRKSIRLPASSDVALLSSLTAQLRERASLHLSHPVNAGLIAYPALTGLYEEAVNDAADHVHLRALTGYFSRQPRNIFAPYAGYGLGLCERGVNYSQCRDELLALPARETVRNAIDSGFSDVPALADLAGGEGSPFEPQRLQRSVLEVLEAKYRFLDRPVEMTVIFSGDRADETLVRQNIANAVNGSGSQPHVLADEAVFIEARGAAQAWRAIHNRATADVRTLQQQVVWGKT